MLATNKIEIQEMEIGAPTSTHVANNSPSIVNNPPIIINNMTKQVRDQPIRYMIGFLYHLAFIALLAGLILAIISLVRDDLTKLRFHSPNGSYTEYCGWRNMHSYDSSSSYLGSPYTFNYRKKCGDFDPACTLEKIGTTWYSLLIIGIVFGGFSLIVFVLDLPVMAARLAIAACNLIFFGCMLADALIWGLYKTCHNACNSLSFPGLGDINGCNPTWGISWILVIIAGGMVFISTILLMLSKSVPKRF